MGSSFSVKTLHTYELGTNKLKDGDVIYNCWNDVEEYDNCIAENTEYTTKIGLMYVSDYGYATSPSNWSTNLGSYNSTTVRDNNWMWMGATEWTISRISDDTNYAFGVSYVGYVNNIYVDLSAGVRPSFYLESSVELESGDGTIDSPYRIQAGA